MISHQYQCIFIHIPKCAGTSIETALGHFEVHSGRSGQDHRSLRMIEKPFLTSKALSSMDNVLDLARRLRHAIRPVKNPRNKITVNRQQFNNYYKFTFVRNPWARVFSSYKNIMRDEVHQKALGISGAMPLGDFVRIYAGKTMIKPQTYWLKDFSGRVRMDYIGRFENLREDFVRVLDALGISDVELPHEQRSGSTDYRESYDDASRRIVQEAYRDECEMFGYSFGD